MTRANLWTPGTEPVEGTPATSLYLPGASGNYVSCPDIAIPGDMDIRAKVTWQDSKAIISKQLNGTTRSWSLQFYTLGRARLYVSPDGSTIYTFTSSFSAFTAGGLVWVRVTLDVDDGAGGSLATFYSSVDGETWVAVGTGANVAFPSGLYDNAQPIEIGSQYSGTSNNMVGLAQYAEIRNGIDGPIVAQWDGSVPHERQVDPQGNVWTVNGTANAWQEV